MFLFMEEVNSVRSKMISSDSSPSKKKKMDWIKYLTWDLALCSTSISLTLRQPCTTKPLLPLTPSPPALECPKMMGSWNPDNRFTLRPFLGEMFFPWRLKTFFLISPLNFLTLTPSLVSSRLWNIEINNKKKVF